MWGSILGFVHTSHVDHSSEVAIKVQSIKMFDI